MEVEAQQVEALGGRECNRSFGNLQLPNTHVCLGCFELHASFLYCVRGRSVVSYCVHVMTNHTLFWCSMKRNLGQRRRHVLRRRVRILWCRRRHRILLLLVSSQSLYKRSRPLINWAFALTRLLGSPIYGGFCVVAEGVPANVRVYGLAITH